MLFTQGRIFADSPDSAAIKIRDKHKEHEGWLIVLEAEPLLGWYEYTLQITSGDWGR